MKIVADDNIPAIREWCGSFGQIELVAGRELRRAHLLDADVLLVRSVTRVDETLLGGTPVRFVGTATAGVDHIDLDYLDTRSIHFAAAPGCNAVAVAEYVLACCLAHAQALDRPLAEMTLGIVGCGHAGSAVRRVMRVLGVTCLVSDPPRALREPEFDEQPFAEVLHADIVSLHVPLVADGAHATRRMIGAAQIAAMKPTALLINAARGGIVVESDWLGTGAGNRKLVLDCWEGEPRIAPASLARCWIGSPHIAGHSVEARLRATAMLAVRLAAFLGLEVPPPPPAPPVVRLAGSAATGEWQALIFACCNPHSYTRALRATGSSDVGEAFDRLRKLFGTRREFSAHTVYGVPGDHPQYETLTALGFALAA